MSIKVLGSGCKTCKKLFDLTKTVVSELQLNIEVLYITDVQEIIKLGLIQSPVLVVNEKVILVGFIGEKEKIKKLIMENI